MLGADVSTTPEEKKEGSESTPPTGAAQGETPPPGKQSSWLWTFIGCCGLANSVTSLCCTPKK
jgi:hypothetical protein